MGWKLNEFMQPGAWVAILMQTPCPGIERHSPAHVAQPENKLSRPIVRIATGAIAVGVALMMASVCVLKAFNVKFETRRWALALTSKWSPRPTILPLRASVSSRPGLYHHPGAIFRHIQQFALKPGIMETAKACKGSSRALHRTLIRPFLPSTFRLVACVSVRLRTAKS